VINILNTIGNTPLVRLEKVEKHFGLMSKIYAKAEFMNPGGSIKDRAALAIIDEAEKKGLLKNRRIVEATSGNMGISFAMIGALRGYNVSIVMPDNASEERECLIKAYGARVIRTKEGMSEAIDISEAIAKHENSFTARQFENTAAVNYHYQKTGYEIWRDMGGNIDFFIAGVGTGATIVGIGRYLKERTRVKVIAVEPANSPVLSGGKAGAHRIEGIGAGFIPKLYDATLVDEVVGISDEEAIEMSRILANKEGLLAGISGGANLAAAVKIGKYNSGNTIIPIPDRGERYFSKGVFSLD
jgi:cysteine synthase A